MLHHHNGRFRAVDENSNSQEISTVYPNLISINQLAELCMKDRRTVKERLYALEPVATKGVAELYDIRRALQLIFAPERDKECDDAPEMREKYLLYQKRRELLEIQIKEKERSLIPRQELDEFLAGVFSSIRARVLQFPAKMAQNFVANSDSHAVQLLAKTYALEALVDLSEGKIDGFLSGDAEDSSS